MATRTRTGLAGSLKALLDEVALDLVHAAEESEDPLVLVALAEATDEVVERGLVLGEDHQSLVVAPAAVVAEQVFDQLRRAPRSGRRRRVLLGEVVAGDVEARASATARSIAAISSSRSSATALSQAPTTPAAVVLACLGLAVVAGLLSDAALGGGHVGVARRLVLGEALLAAPPRLGERGRAAEQPLAEDLDREAAERRRRRSPCGDELLHRLAESVEGVAERLLLRATVEAAVPCGGRRVQNFGGFGARVDLALEAAEHDLLDALLLGRLELVGLAEADRVEDLEQAGEAAGVAVVRRGAEEEAVLELRREEAEHAAEVAVVAEGRRHEVVALVDDEQVPRQVRRALGRAAGRQELLEHVVLPQVVVRGDDAAEGAPRVGVHPEALAQRVRSRRGRRGRRGARTSPTSRRATAGAARPA